jgi:very-short-patch-repair endonuclease
MRRELDNNTLDRRIAEIAARQHGLITSAQLVGLGVDSSRASRRAQAGRLHRLYRGVYAVGHKKVSHHGRWLAAVLACGPGAVLSHRSAAALWGIRPQSSGPIELTVPGSGGRAHRPGLILHRSQCLEPGETTRTQAIPATTPARTLADLGRVLEPDHLDAAIRRAEVMRLDIGVQPGYEPDLTRSELERRFLRLCRRRGLPPPEVNVQVDSFLVDFLWPEQSLIVETDGFRHHGTRSAFEADRARDARLRLLGYSVLRFTQRQLADDPAAVAGMLRALIGAGV